MRASALLRLTGSASLLALGAMSLGLAVPVQADNLREALVGAYTTNPTLEGARADQRATDEGVPIQRAQGLPSANITATHIEFLRQSANSFTAPQRNLGVNAQLLVPVYSGGAIRNGIAAAKERVEAGQAALRNTESTLFSQVVAAYMDVLRTEALTALATNNVAVLRTNLEATSDRFQIGDQCVEQCGVDLRHQSSSTRAASFLSPRCTLTLMRDSLCPRRAAASVVDRPSMRVTRIASACGTGSCASS